MACRVFPMPILRHNTMTADMGVASGSHKESHRWHQSPLYMTPVLQHRQLRPRSTCVEEHARSLLSCSLSCRQAPHMTHLQEHSAAGWLSGRWPAGGCAHRPSCSIPPYDIITIHQLSCMLALFRSSHMTSSLQTKGGFQSSCPVAVHHRQALEAARRSIGDTGASHAAHNQCIGTGHIDAQHHRPCKCAKHSDTGCHVLVSIGGSA